MELNPSPPYIFAGGNDAPLISDLPPKYNPIDHTMGKIFKNVLPLLILVATVVGAAVILATFPLSLPIAGMLVSLAVTSLALALFCQFVGNKLSEMAFTPCPPEIKLLHQEIHPRWVEEMLKNPKSCLDSTQLKNFETITESKKEISIKVTEQFVLDMHRQNVMINGKIIDLLAKRTNVSTSEAELSKIATEKLISELDKMGIKPQAMEAALKFLSQTMSADHAEIALPLIIEESTLPAKFRPIEEKQKENFYNILIVGEQIVGIEDKKIYSCLKKPVNNNDNDDVVNSTYFGSTQIRFDDSCSGKIDYTKGSATVSVSRQEGDGFAEFLHTYWGESK